MGFLDSFDKLLNNIESGAIDKQLDKFVGTVEKITNTADVTIEKVTDKVATTSEKVDKVVEKLPDQRSDAV